MADSTIRRPNVFIVGAPKCGTTALSGYLGTHPNVFFSQPKEPCWFSADFPGQREVRSLDEYLGLFADAKQEHLAIGEGSVWYLYSQVALRNIRDFNSQAKIVVMLRNPVEQVYSMHQELHLRRYETQGDFIKAWELQEARRNGRHVPKFCKEARFLQYRQIAEYAPQLERLLEHFPREQVKVIIFDDFKADTRRVYLELMDHLQLPDDGKLDFKPSLESRRHKLHWLGSFLINQPPWLESVKSQVKKTLRIQRLGVRDLVARHNTVVEKRKALPADFVAQLKDVFREDVGRVSDLLKRDLSHWCQ